MRLLQFCLLLILTFSARAAEPFAFRGYYLTFMRMPVMGLPEWKMAVDCFAQDDANTLILWTAGGFRSKKFPITWQYNQDHENIRHDFFRDLIEYAHTKKIRVLLGFTPFGYDGVNRYAIEHPELKARKPDNSPVDEFGIHSWGWNLCPAQEESQRFMREYFSEMAFDFYPNADGLLIESSDYSVCKCKDCGPKYYDNEFRFVRWASDEMWKRKPDSLILVYPHYFSGKKVPGFEVTAARQQFDPRWALSFSPHSSHFEPNLMRQARANFYWSDAPALGTPQRVRDAARAARDHSANGFLPSLEAFSYVTQHTEGGEAWLIGKRMKPFGFDALTEDKMPYNTLPARVQRYAVREFSKNPDLAFPEFEHNLSQNIFNSAAPDSTKDLLELQRIWNFERDWYWPSPLLDPDFFQQRARRLKWPESKLSEYDKNLERLKLIAKRYATSQNAAEKEMANLAQTVIDRWGEKTPNTLKP
jgi:hypothetical protein